MRVAIAGAGNVGQSIARAVLRAGHQVLLIERQRSHYRPSLVPDADWLWADACELGVLQAGGIRTTDVVIAATGGDQTNLVFAWLSKTEFTVPRVVARVNDPNNQWLFTPHWGVDVAVSTPRTIVAAVEAALSNGEVVRRVSTQAGGSTMIELALPAASSLVGRALGDLTLPVDAVVLGVIRRNDLLAPATHIVLDAADRLLVLAAPQVEDRLRTALT
jgi:trk system potassium uptake protein TrkA